MHWLRRSYVIYIEMTD